jgi:predicted RNA-binding protein with PUA-like domain
MAGNILPTMSSPRHWLMKSEPTSFSFNDLVKSKNSTNHWDGVRNYQARNYMREMRVGDRVLFYHSNCDQPGVVGLAEVVQEAYPDHTQFDPKEIHYDPKAKRDQPIWDMVNLRAIKPLRNPMTLDVLRKAKGLEKMILLRRGSRLSVQPVSPTEWEIIVKLGV